MHDRKIRPVVGDLKYTLQTVEGIYDIESLMLEIWSPSSINVSPTAWILLLHVNDLVKARKTAYVSTD